MKSPFYVLLALEYALILTKLRMIVMKFETTPTLFCLIPYSTNKNMAKARAYVVGASLELGFWYDV
jgi:hypothetical protein